MGNETFSSDRVMAELIGMGFEFSDIEEAIKCVGPSLDAAVEFILNASCGKGDGPSTSSAFISNSSKEPQGDTASASSLHDSLTLLQPSMNEYLKCSGKLKRRKVTGTSGFKVPFRPGDTPKEALCNPKLIKGSSSDIPVALPCNEDVNGPDWEQSVNDVLHKHFGYSLLKAFQKEALAAWLSHRDCLVLAATGSGKSLCFQIPALLTGKVVVVISPLISLMHDQCLKLAKHGVSACFLGSGQIDKTVEQKALRGLYSIIYVCPETVLRLIKPLQSLAEGRGIALFAIDEVHCVSKWGHDFRPDYRRLSVLRESFSAEKLRFLKFDIPLMALTATATICVRDDILKSLRMSKDTKIILTSFFRPNLRFSVKHSRTSSLASYERDFHELIEIYSGKKNLGKMHDFKLNFMDVAPDTVTGTSTCNIFEQDRVQLDECPEDDELGLSPDHGSPISEEKLSVEYLEDECDVFCDTDDLDVSCGGFSEQLPLKHLCEAEAPDTHYLQSRPEERLKHQIDPLGEGPTIIYVPTRKETLSIAKFLGKFGVRAAAYNAKLPKSHLRQVHKEFQDNIVQVVVATIAFGMGIDKLNVRRIIHYGWPQSLEAYYQEAGRAGRDGKLADCVLVANLSRTPSLLPSSRSEEQTKQAYKMLSDCFRYGMNTSSCRAKILVEYFGEEFMQEKCLVCDSCIKGSPEVQNLKKEATILMQAIVSHRGPDIFEDGLYGDDITESCVRQSKFVEKPFKIVVSEIRQQHPEFISSDLLWWRGLARILEGRKYIREGDDKTHVQIKFPEATKSGVEFMRSENPSFDVHPEADMVLSMSKTKSYSSFAEWGKGWADPEIRRQRLESRRSRRKYKKQHQAGTNTVRGRLATKLSKKR